MDGGVVVCGRFEVGHRDHLRYLRFRRCSQQWGSWQGEVWTSAAIPDRAAGVQLHITSLPGGRLGEPARDFVRWLAAAGQSVWQVLPTPFRTSAARPTPAPRRSLPGRACSRTPPHPWSRQEVEAYADAHAYWARVLDLRGRRAGRPGALRAGVGRAAVVRSRSRRPGCSGTCRSTSPPTVPTPGPGPSCFRDDAVAGVPPDAFTETGQLWGNPLYDWDAHGGRRLPVVGGATAPQPVALRPRPGRPPGLRGILGRAGRARDRRARRLGARSGAGRLRRRDGQGRTAAGAWRRTSA